MIRLAGASLNQIPLDWTNNTQNSIQAIEAAKKEKVDILCLPELCITGYGCEDLFLSEWLYEKTWEQLLEIVPHCKNITVAIGLPVRIEGKAYSAVCLIHDGTILGITCKQHLANDGVHYEPRWFTPWIPGRVVPIKRGDLTIQAGDIIYPVHGIRLGFEICEDGWRKEERPGYSLCKRGIDLILNPSASHFAMGKSLYREEHIILEATRTFNCVYIFANLLGNEAGRMVYDGDLVIAQQGRILAQGKRLTFARHQLMTCDVDFKDPSKSQAPQLLDIKDRNEELIAAIALGLYDYLRKSKAKGFVLSLSGGADSGMCAVLVAEMVKRAGKALGWKNFCETLQLDPVTPDTDWKKVVGQLLTCAYQGTQNSSPETLRAAQELSASLGAIFHHWTIDEEVSSYVTKIEHVLQRKLTWDRDDISLQNIQARARSPIIWLLANIKNSILLTTSNRSEGDVGYATMDGDTSGSLAPIAGLSKPFILQWLRWAEATLGHTGLHRINSLQPTAELRPPDRHQTDEGDLMPYTILEEIEKLAILERRPPREVYEIMKTRHAEPEQLKAYIRKFFRLWSANQWKRERLAPSFHLDDLNVDPRTWCRFPILSAGFKEEIDEL